MTTASPAVRQTAALAWRSIVTTVRLPQAWFPALFFPLVLMAIFTASFGGAPGVVPGFPPVRGFLDFAVCGAIVQGAIVQSIPMGPGPAGRCQPPGRYIMMGLIQEHALF